MTDAFADATYGALEVGYGERPAVLVVDFQKGFTDPRFRMGKSPRRCNIPVASCYVGWQSKKDLQYWKVAAVQEDFFDGSEAQHVDPKVADPSYDFIFKKCAPSIFFQTPIMPFLTKQRIDTVIVTGCVTSGCIRASTIDAFSYGYRTIVVDDCCGDPMQESHEANLKDMGRRYADIKQSADVLEYFEQVRGKNA
jgi:maleamate amidohydrolase